VSRPEQHPAPAPDPSAQPHPPDPAAPRPPSSLPASREEPALPAPSFEDEIRATVHYERGLAVKALLSIALVAAVLAFRVYFFG
jgi:hypothetical protein